MRAAAETHCSTICRRVAWFEIRQKRMRVLLCLQTCGFSRSSAALHLTRNRTYGTASEIALAADERLLHIPKLEIPPAALPRISPSQRTLLYNQFSLSLS
ncbi:hypothetical protein ISCGN_019428 [Ixodes scapularis]